MANPNWVKGMRSPNPNGKPKGKSISISDCFTDEDIIEAAKGIIEISKSARVDLRFRAKQLIIEYGLGKPTQPIAHDGQINTGGISEEWKNLFGLSMNGNGHTKVESLIVEGQVLTSSTPISTNS